MKKQTITYAHQQQQQQFADYLVTPDSANAKLPLVMLVHDWSGRNEFVCKQAEAMATQGYAALAVDMYGDARVGNNNEEKIALMQPFMENRQLINHRLQRALENALAQTTIDSERVAIMGFCFGGLCALDFARAGGKIKTAISFHGLLTAPATPYTDPITAKILVLHGYKDPMVPPQQVHGFCEEMQQRQADWQLIAYGQALHAFTNPQANDPDFGTVYDATTSQRAWQAMLEHLREIL